MPIYIVPTPSTAKAWQHFVKWPLRVELFAVVASLVCLCFASANAALACTVSVEDYYSASPVGAEYVAIIAINIVWPLFGVFASSLNIYLYTLRTLRPGVVTATSAFLTFGWFLSVGVWVWMNCMTYDSWEGSGDLWVLDGGQQAPWALVGLKAMSGAAAGIATLTQLVFAIKTLRRRDSKAVETPEDTHCPTCSKLVSHTPPKSFNYEDSNYSIYDSTTGVTTGVTTGDYASSATSHRSAHTAPSIIIVNGSTATPSEASGPSAPPSRPRSYSKHPVNERCHCGSCSGDASTVGDESV